MCVNKKDRNVFSKSTSDVNEQGHCKPSLKRVTRESANLFHTARHCIICEVSIRRREKIVCVETKAFSQSIIDCCESRVVYNYFFSFFLRYFD